MRYLVRALKYLVYFAVIFFLFCAMQLVGTTFVLFIAKYPVFAIANIVTMVLLIALYLCARFRE